MEIPPTPEPNPYGTSTIFTALITTGVFGRSFRSRATAAIFSTTSWPFTTWPKMVWWLFS